MPNMELKQPPFLCNAEGKTRRVGVELEMGGLELDALARHVADFLGAQVEAKGRYERVLKGDPAGEWMIELDFDLLKRLGREAHLEDSIADDLERSAEDVLAWAAKAVVPMEVVTPPLPLDRLPDVEKLIVILRDAGAQGTSGKMLNAFGLQFNPELPSTDARLIASCLKAFLCLYDWLHARAHVDAARRVTSYVDPFPKDYVVKVTDPGYWPDQAGLIDDYLADNPTRNRALDMLPLFLHLDEARVRRQADDPLIKARPTFHYRLPNCDINKPGWGLFVSWNDWVEVERLAADEARLNACCTAYRSFLGKPLDRLMGDWASEVEDKWISP